MKTFFIPLLVYAGVLLAAGIFLSLTFNKSPYRFYRLEVCTFNECKTLKSFPRMELCLELKGALQTAVIGHPVFDPPMVIGCLEPGDY